MFVEARESTVFAENFTLSEIIQSDLCCYAIHNALEFTAASASKFSEDRRKVRLLPWSEFVDLRIQPVYICLKIDLPLIWSIVRQEVPVFIKVLERIVWSEAK